MNHFLVCPHCSGRVSGTYDSEHRGLQCLDCGHIFQVEGFREAMADGVKHRCPDCKSTTLRILHRRVQTKLVFFWYCGVCGTEGGDKQTLADAVKDCEDTHAD
jgi:uncharacterized protein YbaR (Trm112 family)